MQTCALDHGVRPLESEAERALCDRVTALAPEHAAEMGEASRAGAVLRMLQSAPREEVAAVSPHVREAPPRPDAWRGNVTTAPTGARPRHAVQTGDSLTHCRERRRAAGSEGA